MQVGNGNLAFGADVTGLQTFMPFNTLSDWAWHNFSLPSTAKQTSPEDFTGLDWYTHGRFVNYDQPNPAENDISSWLIQNPQRLNLGRIGFWFGSSLTVTDESQLSNKTQSLDPYSGIIISSFQDRLSTVRVRTAVSPNSDTVAIDITSELLDYGHLGVFIDFPYSDVNKFDAPFVGVWNATLLPTPTLQQLNASQARIVHQIDGTTYYTTVSWEGEGSIEGPEEGTHRYVLKSKTEGGKLQMSVNFSPTPPEDEILSPGIIFEETEKWWREYRETGAFIDLTGTPSNSSYNATELQRRIILSQYLQAVNSAGHDSPQESGLVNNGWYGKFYLEMSIWHLGHWARWFDTESEGAGVRGCEMGSAPGEINSLLIWQQPHVMYWAEMEWREFRGTEVLRKWEELVTKSADFIASFA